MLLVAVFAGALLGVMCDGLFILRLLLHDPRAVSKSDEVPRAVSDRSAVAWMYTGLRGFCDFLAVLFATVILILLCYYTSDGQLRAPAIFGMIAGFWGYHKTVSRWIRRLLSFVLVLLRRILCFLWSHTLGRMLGACSRAVVRRYRDAATARRLDALTRSAAQGFGLTDEPPRSNRKKEP